MIRVSDAMNFTGDTSPTGPWIDFQIARALCKTVNIHEDFRHFFVLPDARLAQVLTDSQLLRLQKKPASGHTSLILNEINIRVRKRDCWINAT